MIMYKLTNTNSVIKLIPYLHIPEDPTNIDRQAYEKWLAEGNVPEHAQTIEQQIASLANAIQNKLDSWALLKSYAGILVLCSYATSTNPTYLADSKRGIEVRDACWAYWQEIAKDIEAGKIPLPTEDELLSTLPITSWED